jgi:hypothetical protein
MLAGLAEGFEPGEQDVVVGRLEVEELNAHADAGLDDADNDQSFNDLAFPHELQTGAGIHGKRLAGADETPAQRDVGGDALHLFTGFEVNQLNIASKWKSDGVAAVADPGNVGVGSITVGHGEDFIHLAHLEHERAGKSLRAIQTLHAFSLPEGLRVGNGRLADRIERVTRPPARAPRGY